MDFAQSVLEDKPDHIKDDEFVNRLYDSMKGSGNRKTLKMVQFTDLHVDLEYTVGAAVNCDNVLCCRPKDGFPTDPKNQATKYGNYWCDIPADLFYIMGDFIKSKINPDVVFWTGDIPPHD